MATLADSFLVDLDELSSDYELEDGLAVKAYQYAENDISDEFSTVSKLQETQRFKDIIQKVEHALQNSPQSMENEHDPEIHQLIIDCNSLLTDIEDEIVAIHSYIREKYGQKFPELESLVRHPIDYAHVVKKIGNETDLTLVDLQGLVPSASIMVVSIVASTTNGKPLSEDVLGKTIEACDQALVLDAAKKRVFDFMESRMLHIAPNLSAIVATVVAAKLVGTAGGLLALGTNTMPLCKIKNTTDGNTNFCMDCLKQTEIFQSTPLSLQTQCFKLLAAKCALAARVDCWGGDPTGKWGRMLRDEICKIIAKLQEPRPPRMPKPLPVPDYESRRKKRGGRRLRKIKERYGMTDRRRLANRMLFGVPEESSLGDGLGVGFGMIGQVASGKLRLSYGNFAANKLKEKHYGNSGNISGLTSISLTFTSVQGMQLVNPQAHAHQLGSGTQSMYFSETGTFSRFN